MCFVCIPHFSGDNQGDAKATRQACSANLPCIGKPACQEYAKYTFVTAMRAKFNKADYTTEKLNSKIDNKIKILSLIDLS